MGWMLKGSPSSLLLPWLATSEPRQDLCRESGRDGSAVGVCRADLSKFVNGGSGWEVKAAAASGQSEQHSLSSRR